MSDYKTQIVVIAGGPSGLSAAVQAAEVVSNRANQRNVFLRELAGAVLRPYAS